MSFELTGRLTRVDETTVFPSGFQKRCFNLFVEDGKYSQTIKFELLQDKIDLIDAYKTDAEINVTFDIRGNELPDGRVFNSLVAWKIQPVAGSQSPPEPREDPEGYKGRAATPDAPDDFEDDIPF